MALLTLVLTLIYVFLRIRHEQLSEIYQTIMKDLEEKEAKMKLRHIAEKKDLNQYLELVAKHMNDNAGT